MYYRNTNENVTVINDRSSEGLADANIRIGDMNCQVTDLEIKLEAIYRVMVEQGVDPKLFDAKIEEIMKERQEKKGLISAQPQSKPCPKCGKPVKKSTNSPMLGRCMYCGTNVPFYPSFTKDEQPDPTADLLGEKDIF